MKTQFPRLVVTLMALLCSSAGMAASVTITASTLTPTVGDTFTLTMTSDAPNTFAATLALAFDATKVEYVSGVALAPWNVYVKNSPVTANPTVFDIETPTATSANPGVYNAAELTFRAIAAGAANIVINDDGGFISGWFDADTAEGIPTTYTQASVVVSAANAPSITVTDDVPPADDEQVPFGSVTVGSTSPTRTVTVTNSGTADLVIGTVAGLAAPYTIISDSCTGQTLAPASPCTIGLEFAPAATGSFPDSFDIPSNDPGFPSVTVTVSGTGAALPAPSIVVTDSVAPTTDNQIPFGNVLQNTTETETVTVTNDGNANLAVGQIAVGDPAVTVFTITNDTCSNQTVVPAASCTFNVAFLPTAVAPYSNTVNIPSDDPDAATVPVSVTGTGVDTAVPDITVTDSANPPDDLLAAFGDVNVSASADITVTVTNDGLGDLVVGDVAVANPVAAPFSITADNCSNVTLNATESCTLVVTFSPGALQIFPDSFDIPSNDPDEATVTMATSGTGTAQPVPNIVVTDSVAPTTDLQIPFGSVTQNTTVTQTVTVTNDGNANLAVGPVVVNNPAVTAFTITNDTCSNQAVVPLASCTFNVAFLPTAATPYANTVNIPSNDPNTATAAVSVSGTGAGSAVPSITVTDSANPPDDLLVAFGDVNVNALANRTVTVTNDGVGSLVVGDVAVANPLAAPFSIITDNCSDVTLVAAASCTIVVSFTPDASGSFPDSFDIPSNDPDDPTVTMAVSGTGRPLTATWGGSSSLDPATALLLGLFGLAAWRRPRSSRPSGISA